VTRTTKEDWLRAGLEILRDSGELELTIERLSASVKKTKGSFYHHFVDMPAYLNRLLEFWETENTLEPIDAANAGGSAAERRKLLEVAIAQLDLRIERAVQAWALRDARASRVRARVDARRVEYLADLWRSSGASKRRAEQLAQIEYAAFLGALQQTPDLGPWRSQNALLLRALAKVAAS
jgi:AcrR family transcriptional regulator